MTALSLFIYTVCFSVCALGLTYEVIKDQPGYALQCNSLVVISCKFAVNTPIIKWKIAPDVQNTTITAATCFSNSCVIHSSFATSNYSFTFDKQVGVSNLTIKKVTFEIEKFEFQCDDSVTFVPVKYNVTEPPSKQTISISYTTDELRVETACVYPAENVIIKWYSRVNESSERIPHTTSPPRRTLCNASDDCILANKSANITSDLNLSQLTVPAANSVERNAITSSEMRIFEVEIIYDSGNFSIVLGNFSVQDKTETTTYSTVKLTPTPTIVITSTTTPVITPTQTIVLSPTPTTVVSPTSTIVVASQSTDKPSSSTKQNFLERNKSVIIASSTGGAVTLIIIISACVCYIKRKRRNKRKAKKHMLSKEDTNVQEIKL